VLTALPGENGTHDIGVEMNTKTSKNIPNIINCNLKKDDQILIVLHTSIPDTNGHQMKWELEWSFGGQLYQGYSYQKLSKSNSLSSSYNR